MFEKTYHGVHPDMMAGASNAELRDRHLVTDLFRAGEVVLTYSHGERFVIGGAVPDGAPLALPRQTEPDSAAGHSLLERRELGVVNIGKSSGTVLIDGVAIDLARHEALYVPMGTGDVRFLGDGARFYLLSVPAHARFPLRKMTIDDAGSMARGSLETANDRVFHFMGRPDDMRHIVVGNEQAVISPPWSVHMGAGTRHYSFIWAMAGENQEYDDMQVCDICQLR